MKWLFSFRSLAAVCLVFSIVTAEAVRADETRSPYRKSILLDDDQLERIGRLHDKLANTSSTRRFVTLQRPLVIKTAVPFLGRVRIVFNKLRYFRYGSRLLIDGYCK